MAEPEPPLAGGVAAAKGERDDAGNLELLAALCPPDTGRDFLFHLLRDLHAGDMQVPAGGRAASSQRASEPSAPNISADGDGRSSSFSYPPWR